MLHSEPLDGAVLLHDVNGAPVGQDGYREACHVSQSVPVIEGRRERRAALGQEAQHVVRVLALRRVVHHHREAFEVPFSIPEGGNDSARPEPGAVLANLRPLLHVTALCQRRTQYILGVSTLHILFRVEGREVPAQDLLFPVTFYTLCAVVPGRYASSRVEHEDRVVLHPLHHQPEALLALAQTLLMAPGLQRAPLGPIPGRTQRGSQHTDKYPFERESEHVYPLDAESRDGAPGVEEEIICRQGANGGGYQTGSQPAVPG